MSHFYWGGGGLQYIDWETYFHPVLVLGRIVLSLRGSQTAGQDWVEKSCTHGSRNVIQYWGWGLVLQAPVALPGSGSVLDKVKSTAFWGS